MVPSLLRFIGSELMPSFQSKQVSGLSVCTCVSNVLLGCSSLSVTAGAG